MIFLGDLFMISTVGSVGLSIGRREHRRKPGVDALQCPWLILTANRANARPNVKTDTGGNPNVMTDSRRKHCT